MRTLEEIKKEIDILLRKEYLTKEEKNHLVELFYESNSARDRETEEIIQKITGETPKEIEKRYKEWIKREKENSFLEKLWLFFIWLFIWRTWK